MIVPTSGYNTELNTLINKFNKQNLITEKTENSLKSENPRHKSPTIHKQGNPEMPVANSINSHSSNLYKFIDYYLQPHVQTYHRTLNTLQILFKK